MASYNVGSKWSYNDITWSFAEYNYVGDLRIYSSYITQNDYQNIVKAAFGKWASVANIKFTETTDSSSSTNSSDLRLGFYKFGNSNIIGQTVTRSSNFTFVKGTQILFEDPSELSIIGSDYHYNGYTTTFYQVVLHEIGHGLGFLHNNVDKYSIMWPSAEKTNQNLDLSDVAGIQSLYGPNSNYMNFYVQDITTGDVAYLGGDTFDGPSSLPMSKELVIGSTSDIVTTEVISHSLNITSYGPNAFILGGDGDDSINVSSTTGTYNTLDGGLGSNFLVGSLSATNIFYEDLSTAQSKNNWTSFVNAHKGDSVYLWGLQESNWPQISWQDDTGATGYTGLTGSYSINGHVDTFTFAGYDSSDIASGKFFVSFGKTDSQVNYMEVKFTA